MRQIGWASRVAWLSVGLALAGPVLGVRVQVLDLVLATAVVWVLWRYMVDRRRRWLIGLPLITVAWANLHAGWVLVFLLGGAVLVGETADRLLRRTPDGQPLGWRPCATWSSPSLSVPPRSWSIPTASTSTVTHSTRLACRR